MAASAFKKLVCDQVVIGQVNVTFEKLIVLFEIETQTLSDQQKFLIYS